MERAELTVKIIGEYQFESSFGYRNQTSRLYKMQDEAGQVYVWKTTGFLEIEVPGEGDCIDSQFAREGDTVRIKATIKGQSEYKGEQQTELSRVKLLGIIEKGEDLKQKKQARRAAEKRQQLDSIKGEDFIWKMPYSQFKAHYSDCETIIDSYQEHIDQYGFIQGPPTVEVIIREGRLKASGTRGRHYAGYRISFEIDGKRYVEPFRAVCERTAINQARKAHPDAKDFELEDIIIYNLFRD